jgi:hypothetical protein
MAGGIPRAVRLIASTRHPGQPCIEQAAPLGRVYANGDSGSETSQRSHTSWHETVLGIDSRTAR